MTDVRLVSTGVALSAPTTPPHPDRVTRGLLIAIGIYSFVLVAFANVVVSLYGKAHERAIILMLDGLLLFWVVLGGALTPMLRWRLVPRLAALPLDWRVRFVLLCTTMALIEEAIATFMTNLAPLFGSTTAEAHITASTNYLTVVCFHSVVVFIPMFIAWAVMLSFWRFTPLQVLLLFGITGSLAEGMINPTNLISGFWVFIYGLMIYLPACTVTDDRPVSEPRWWHYPVAVFLPIVAATPAVPVIIFVRQWLDVKLFPGT